ncbi:unnamed protein product [Vitrella brassicaformis CCMP3155]|uniref:Uncharacterized protein n=2 Tax=Vitrella brassicaformis TaxID=1169539 RepID=A0A0G4ES68_VITBC|nr:unnamed protein product [Vitrella brassicaformis CCMP3155]|eukprot:CEM00510.1 unnamed protein product [Vitrella brassicaformis CCMP3155]
MSFRRRWGTLMGVTPFSRLFAIFASSEPKTQREGSAKMASGAASSANSSSGDPLDPCRPQDLVALSSSATHDAMTVSESLGEDLQPTELKAAQPALLTRKQGDECDFALCLEDGCPEKKCDIPPLPDKGLAGRVLRWLERRPALQKWQMDTQGHQLETNLYIAQLEKRIQAQDHDLAANQGEIDRLKGLLESPPPLSVSGDSLDDASSAGRSTRASHGNNSDTHKNADDEDENEQGGGSLWSGMQMWTTEDVGMLAMTFMGKRNKK